MKLLTTILGLLAISFTASADAGNGSCIDSLHGQTVTVKFLGGESNLWNKVGWPYTARLTFDAIASRGSVTVNSNWGIDYTLVIAPFNSELQYGVDYARHDDLFAPEIKLNCENQLHKATCSKSIPGFIKEFETIKSRLVNADEKSVKALDCTIQTLQMIKY